jgi:tellurite resistance protein TehA-like permease
MGTGIVAVLLHQLPYQFAGLAEISIVFLFITIILFVTLFTLSIIRYTLWPEIFGLMLRHPVESLFLYSPPRWSDYRGSVPMGLATIINMMVYVAVPLSPELFYFTQVLFWIDVVMSLLTCCGVPLFMYPSCKTVDPGSWSTNNPSINLQQSGFFQSLHPLFPRVLARHYVLLFLEIRPPYN